MFLFMKFLGRQAMGGTIDCSLGLNSNPRFQIRNRDRIFRNYEIAFTVCVHFSAEVCALMSALLVSNV